MSDGSAHATSVSIIGAASAECEPGADIVLQVQVACSCGCNLQGGKAMIVDHAEATTGDIELTTFHGAASRTDEFVIQVPAAPGEYTWTAVFPEQEHAGTWHRGGVMPFSFVVRSHTLSITLLDGPGTIRTNARFKIRIGARCSAGCDLAGKEVDIHDHTGAKVRVAALAEVVPPSAQHTVEVELQAPDQEGDYGWTITLPGTDFAVPHVESAQTFTFRTARPPEHIVTMEVTGRDTLAPIPNATIIIRPLLYRGITFTDRTDDSGVAHTRVPEDEYMIVASCEGYRSFSARFTLTGDIAFKTELWVGTDVHDLNGQPLQEA